MLAAVELGRNPVSNPKQDLSTESVNKQILGTDSISTLRQGLMSASRGKFLEKGTPLK